MHVFRLRKSNFIIAALNECLAGLAVCVWECMCVSVSVCLCVPVVSDNSCSCICLLQLAAVEAAASIAEKAVQKH